ncbi:hypothetical protein PO909_011180 [Leuciscus waleckii]
MHGSSEEDIQATVIKAKKEMAEFTHTGRFWEYQKIRDILGAADPLSSLLEEMDKKGLVVRNIPPLLPAPSSVPQSSSRDAESETPVEPEHRPGVVTNMTVEEWQGITRLQNGSSVAVKEHKMAASQVAEVPWFGLYFDQIRLVMLQGLRSGDDATAGGHFFVSSTGRPIHNPCNDLKRLHAKQVPFMHI